MFVSKKVKAELDRLNAEIVSLKSELEDLRVLVIPRLLRQNDRQLDWYIRLQKRVDELEKSDLQAHMWIGEDDDRINEIMKRLDALGALESAREKSGVIPFSKGGVE